MDKTVHCAIIGSGNIGTDLMIKILRRAGHLELVAMAGADAESEGLARARRLGVATTCEGLEGLMSMSGFESVRIIFDATSARAHVAHDKRLTGHDVAWVDLTPAAVGPFCIPVVNLDVLGNCRNVNMVTCGGQATIPIVHAVSSVAEVEYAEIVASIASKSAGPGTRANIDEFTETTAAAIASVGRAKKAKAIIILNPAEPPMLMRDTVFTLSKGGSREAIEASVLSTVESVQRYVPGYRLKQAVQFEDTPQGLKTTVFVEVEGAAHYLPAYAGNLDIMTSAALAAGEQLARVRQGSRV